MLAKVSSASLVGIEAYVVDVEVDISLGLPAFVTVGCLMRPCARARKESGQL